MIQFVVVVIVYVIGECYCRLVRGSEMVENTLSREDVEKAISGALVEEEDTKSEEKAHRGN